jgi:glycosyltransferase involved in cell wall biosynthesis
MYGHALAPAAVRFRRGSARFSYLVRRVQSVIVLGVRRVRTVRFRPERAFGFKDVARWWWHRIPALGRYWFYRRAVVPLTLWSGNIRSTGPSAIHTLSYRVARRFWRLLPTEIRHPIYLRLSTSRHPVKRFVVRALLWNHRTAARAIWPDVRGFDHLALALWGALLRYHGPALEFAWVQSRHIRRWRRPRAAAEGNRRVLHLTGSFDLGGTQTQIKNLCMQSDAAFEHRAVEVFPEFNYLFRWDVKLDPASYMGRGILGRTAGRLVLHTNHRSSQLVQIYKLVQDIRREQPAVVVGWGHEMCAIAFAAASIARVPHVVFCIRTVNPTYGWVPPQFAEMLLRAHRAMLPFVSKTIVNSTLLQHDHADWVGMNSDHIAVCPNGIAAITPSPADAHATRSRTRAAHGIPDDMVVITNVGRFSGEKGQRSLVEANRLLLASDLARPFTWLLCGDGPTMVDVRAAAASFGMTNMIFAGRTTGVLDVLCASDIFVMPSDFEGMPNAMMEAMASGLPCVSTNRSGALDVARDGLEALYYQPRDAQRLASHLASLINDPDAARALGERAQVRIKEFSVARFVESFERILQSVTTSSPLGCGALPEQNDGRLRRRIRPAQVRH